MANIIKLSAINDYLRDDLKCIQRGEQSLSSGRLEMCNFDAGLKIIKGKVKASMRDKSYDIEVLLGFNYGIETCTCTCPRGQFVCHHMACVLLHAYSNISRTGVACMWVPRATEVTEPNEITTENLFDPLAGERPSNEQLDELKNNLKTVNSSCGLLWLMQEDPNIEVAQKTKGQTDNQAWLISRKHRLTSSNFGEILKAVRRQRYAPSLFKKLTGSYDLERVKQIQWVRQNEANGIQSFGKLTGAKVVRTGLWLHPCGFLGASPDGLIFSDGLIEVKCPYTLRNSTLADNLKKSDILFSENGEYIVNKDHNYYYDQIQGQLHITGRDYCYLVLWTTADVAIKKVGRDKSREKNINILKKFNLNEYLTHISS